MISTKDVRRAAVPLVVIETSDASQTFRSIIEEMNGGSESIPIWKHNLGTGVTGYNPIGQELLARWFDGVETTTINLAEFYSKLNNPDELNKLQSKRTRLYVFVHNPQLYWNNGEQSIFVIQAIWNLRDVFKLSGSQLTMLVPIGTVIPDELRNDVVVLKDTLPTINELDETITSIVKSTNLKPDKIADRSKIIDTLTGIPAFSAEQALAMSFTKSGINLDMLWEKKRKMIEQTPGLSVWRGGETFDDVGGYQNAKDFIRKVCNGKSQPKAIVFLDEIEKSLAGVAGDNTGATQDQLRCFLTYMQDNNALGVIFIGPPGSGKSAIAKAAGNDASIPTIAFDMGAMKNSKLGASEERIRAAFDVVTSVSQGRTLFIATCNSIAILPPELKRRFTLGTFFFPLPDKVCRTAIWKVYRRKFPTIQEMELPDDSGWTGAEIANCAKLADDLEITLIEASKMIVPISVSDADRIDKLCRDSHRRYLSAVNPGIYEYEKLTSQPMATSQTRRIELE